MTAADLVIVDLAAEVAELRERIALTESYREALKAAIQQLYENRRELEYARRRVAALVQELRDRREVAA